MIDLKKALLPEAVEVDGRFYPIHTSFKYWLRFLSVISKQSTTPTDFDFMYTGEKPADMIKGVVALVQFCNPPQELPRTKGNPEKIIDYELDADYIYSAFMEMYGIDLVESKMHWYKFKSLLRGLHDTKLNEIIACRTYENTSGKQDDYTRQMIEMREMWELPQESDENDEDLQAFEALLNP